MPNYEFGAVAQPIVSQTWRNEENTVWEWDPLVSEMDHNMPEFWNTIHQKFGSSGEPGYSEQTSLVSATVFGHANPVNVRWTLNRSESGELLVVHGCYIDAEGYQKPLMLMVNPSHQRQGLGFEMVAFSRERFINERGVDMSTEIAFRNTKTTPAGAAFLNKIVNEDYEKRNSPNEE